MPRETGVRVQQRDVSLSHTSDMRKSCDREKSNMKDLHVIGPPKYVRAPRA
jgi:hypothetical protein